MCLKIGSTKKSFGDVEAKSTSHWTLWDDSNLDQTNSGITNDLTKQTQVHLPATGVKHKLGFQLYAFCVAMSH